MTPACLLGGRAEHFRGVIWAHGPVAGTFRYAVVGILVTDEPIPGLEGDGDILLDGPSAGLADVLAGVRRREKFCDSMGDAVNVLVSLGDWPDDDREATEEGEP